MREVVIDTETTGLNFKSGDRIIEVGCVELKNYVPTGETLQFYCKPDKKITEEAKKIIGLSDDFLKKQNTFEYNHKRLLDFIKQDTLIIHNSEFDLGFINNELSLIGLPPLNNPVVDTVSLARQTLNTRIANLDYLCRRFNIDLSDRSFHGALLDSQLLASVYLELKGGKQFSMQLDNSLKSEKNTSLNNINKQKTKEITPSDEDVSAHKEMLKKIKNPIWNKFNY
ncbi:DNA polymerase III subunit epsilon [Pelagibacteraceae bacterium]|nr:DNA polymerase III subunit epsilon [Pelagibacteraceae bacterium]